MESEVCKIGMIRRGETEVDIVMNNRQDCYTPSVGKVVISSGGRGGVGQQEEREVALLLAEGE